MLDFCFQDIEGHASPHWNKYIVSTLKLNALVTINYIGIVVDYDRDVFISACHGDWEWFGLETESDLVWRLWVIWFGYWEWFILETESDLGWRLRVIWVRDSEWFGTSVVKCFLCVKEYVWRPIYSFMARDRSNGCHHTNNFNSLDCVHRVMNNAPTVFALEIAWTMPWTLHQQFLQ